MYASTRGQWAKSQSRFDGIIFYCVASSVVCWCPISIKCQCIYRPTENFVVIGGTVSCRNDNLWCQQWRQSCQIDDLLFSVGAMKAKSGPLVMPDLHLKGSVRWHDDVIKWKHFPRYWPFMWGIHRWPVNSPHKGQWRVALMFSLICAWMSLSKQSWGWWFETPSRPLWRHSNDIGMKQFYISYLHYLNISLVTVPSQQMQQISFDTMWEAICYMVTDGCYI